MDSADPAVNVSGIVTPFDSAADSRAVTVTDEPSVTGFGEADNDTVGGVVGGVVVVAEAFSDTSTTCSSTQSGFGSNGHEISDVDAEDLLTANVLPSTSSVSEPRAVFVAEPVVLRRAKCKVSWAEFQ